MHQSFEILWSSEEHPTVEASNDKFYTNLNASSNYSVKVNTEPRRKYPPLFTDIEMNNCFNIYQTSE